MKRIKKKPVVYGIILVAIFLITILISHITGVDAGNTWLGMLFANLLKVEARAGIEPAHKGFADLSLTTWVPRLAAHTARFRCRTHKIDLWSVPQ